MDDEDICIEDDEVFVSLGLRAEAETAKMDLQHNCLDIGYDAQVLADDEAKNEPRFSNDKERTKIKKRETFSSIVDFRMALRQNTIFKEFEVHKVVTDKKRYGVECKGKGTPWRIVAYRLVGQATVEEMADNNAGKNAKITMVADWDAHETSIFCKICVEEAEIGNAPHGRLTAKGFNNLIEKFAARTRRDSLKGPYDFWISLVHTTGIGWDSHLKAYTASDDFWQNNTKRNKERKAIRFGPPANLEMEVMFAKSKVSGHSSCIPGQAEAEPSSIQDFESAEDDELEHSPAATNSTSKTTRTRGLKRKNKTHNPHKKRKNSMVRVFSRMVDDVISSNPITSKVVQGGFIRDEIGEVVNLAKESGATEGSDEHYMATKLFVKPENRAMFLTFGTNKGRLDWLKRSYEERNN